MPDEINDLKCVLLTLRETLWWIALKAGPNVTNEMALTTDGVVERCLGRIAIMEMRLSAAAKL